ncbi:hypothetical protein [Paenibacillus cymbidii]|nr:hypothetical protein [Paenibacillus cymbidii]
MQSISPLQVRELGGGRTWRPVFDGRGFRIEGVTGNIEVFW